MHKILMPFLLLAISVTSSCSSNISNLEEIVIQRVESDSTTAIEHFLQQIEDGASVEEQAIYMYGIGFANEQLGTQMKRLTIIWPLRFLVMRRPNML